MDAQLVKYSHVVRNSRFIDMNVGQLGRILQTGTYYGHYVVRFRDMVIDLTTVDYWPDLENNTLIVEILPPGSIVELTQ